MEKGVRDVTRDEDTLNTEIQPGSGQVREGNIPFLFALVDMGFKQKIGRPHQPLRGPPWGTGHAYK
jgi:hypothetical protein